MAKSCLCLVLHLSVLIYIFYFLKMWNDILANMDYEKFAMQLRKSGIFQQNISITKEKVQQKIKTEPYLGLLYFTMWNFTLQIVFLMLAVTDEATKLMKLSKIQRLIEKSRLYLFSTLVFPSSLLVVSVFWSIWHIDRELIFPKVIDDFYPSWLNHTLHTLIVIPLIVEVLTQFKNVNYRISRKQAGLVLLVYCSTYQLLYLSVYLKHGIWLYPVYKVLNWTQRIGFTLLQLSVIILYQQIGISLLNSRTSPKTKTK